MAEGGTVGMMPEMIQGGTGVVSSSMPSGMPSGMPTYTFNRTIGGTAEEPTVDQYFSQAPKPSFVPTGAPTAAGVPGFLANPVSDFGGGGFDGFDGGPGPGPSTGDSGPSTGDSGPGPSGADGGPGTGAGWSGGGILQAYKRMAAGGMSSLGSYSDGGRLLKGPGDGVSDNIPAVIGKRQPARLADGEFVLPARIVSEIGNGSTAAGARELYKMMARIQKNRSKTVGKDKVAVDAKSRKLLPA